MLSIEEKLNKRIRILNENEENIQRAARWKDPSDGSYDRQKAEDALFHTIGPLTDNPRWVNKEWSSPGAPVEGFRPGAPAPQWTQDEVVMAYAGDPNMMFKGSTDNPRSPHYGNKGGAPLMRLAKKVARYWSRDKDRQFIMDLYGNGFVPLITMMQPGYDEGRSPFISWVTADVKSAMMHGFGGQKRTNYAAGRESKETGLIGVQNLAKMDDSDEVRSHANKVKGKYQTTKSHDKTDENPFGPFSTDYYQRAMNYADALDSGIDDQIDAARNDLLALQDEIEDWSIMGLGASTGLGQAISTQDRETKIDIGSMDVSSDDGESTQAGNIEGGVDPSSYKADTEVVKYILDIALNTDLKNVLKGTKYEKLGLGGMMPVVEYRYIMRTLGASASDYPGKGKVRQNLQIPREAKGWWQTGEDPEIEPIPESSGQLWKSIWIRQGHPNMGPAEIAAEMTQEVEEFNQLGIPTKRTIKTKIVKGKERKETVSQAAIVAALKKAKPKVEIIAELHADDIGISRGNISLEERFKKAGIISESFDHVDRQILVEGARAIVNRINWALIQAYAPKYKVR